MPFDAVSEFAFAYRCYYRNKIQLRSIKKDKKKRNQKKQKINQSNMAFVCDGNDFNFIIDQYMKNINLFSL